MYSTTAIWVNHGHCNNMVVTVGMHYIKGTVQRDFRPPDFFLHNSNLSEPLTKGLKIFSILVENSPSGSNFSLSLLGHKFIFVCWELCFIIKYFLPKPLIKNLFDNAEFFPVSRLLSPIYFLTSYVSCPCLLSCCNCCRYNLQYNHLADLTIS